MAGVNKVIILGRLGKDPELKSFDSGDKVCSFPVATSEVYTDRNNERQERTEWHNIVLRNRMAEVASQYLSKGKEVYIEGKLRTRQYEDSNKQVRYITEIIGLSMNLIGGKAENSSSTPPVAQAGSSPKMDSPISNVSINPQDTPLQIEDDDLPF